MIKGILITLGLVISIFAILSLAFDMPMNESTNNSMSEINETNESDVENMTNMNNMSDMNESESMPMCQGMMDDNESMPMMQDKMNMHMMEKVSKKVNDLLLNKTGDEFDRAFILEMATHHNGAIMMSQAALEKSNNSDIISFANKTSSNQLSEMNAFGGYWDSWKYNETSPTGFLSEIVLAELQYMNMEDILNASSQKNGTQFDSQYLTDTIAHHEDAIEMARIAGQNAKHDEIKTMAQKIVSDQTAEIEELKAIKNKMQNMTTEN